jgi:16S rRNA (guanine(966)-N(2))-methyltransferase RsmD
MNNRRNDGRNRRRGPRPQRGRGAQGGQPQRGGKQGGRHQRGQQPPPQQQQQQQGGSQNLIRICGGEAKGRMVRTPVGLGVRPTSEKVREAVFDILGPRIEGALFYDLFAGTGAMGIEALSRGARQVLFVESSRKVEMVIRSNATGSGFANRFMVWAGDFLDFCNEAREGHHETPDIVYVDPPYAIENHLDLIKGVARTKWHRKNPDMLVIMERPSRRVEFDPGDLPHPFRVTDTRKYGDTNLVFFSAKPEEEAEEEEA